VEKGPVRVKEEKKRLFVGDEVDLAGPSWCNVI
jgi:hypothetical protein